MHLPVKSTAQLESDLVESIRVTEFPFSVKSVDMLIEWQNHPVGGKGLGNKFTGHTENPQLPLNSLGHAQYNNVPNMISSNNNGLDPPQQYFIPVDYETFARWQQQIKEGIRLLYHKEPF